MKKREQPSLLNFGLKKRKWTAVTGTGILCLIIAETIISAVTDTDILCLIIAEAIISAGTGLLVSYLSL